MLSSHDVEQIKQLISERRETLEKVLSLLAVVQSALDDQENAMERYELAYTQFQDSEEAKALLRLLTGAEEADVTRGRSNVQIYEEIILDNGQPMHATAIASEAEQRGVKLQGAARKPRQVRNSLSGSKRFVNLGGNVWWIEGRLIPNSDLNDYEGNDVMDDAVLSPEPDELMQSRRMITVRARRAP